MMKYIKKYESVDIDWDDVQDEEISEFQIPDGLTMDEYEKYVGSTVRLKKGTEYYQENSNRNPSDINGTLSMVRGQVYSDYIYNVVWDNGEWNHYRPIDLELVD